MLVLSRQRDETIMIGDEIEITVVDIRGDKVRLGITAPTRIAVHRKEVYEAIKTENERAASIEDRALPAVTPQIAPGPQRNRRSMIAARTPSDAQAAQNAAADQPSPSTKHQSESAAERRTA